MRCSASFIGEPNVRRRAAFALRFAVLSCLALLATAPALLATAPALAAPLGSPAANESIARCREADWLVGNERAHLLSTGMRLAEEAVDANGSDAAAHFAVFCNLGKQLQAGGVNPWILSDVKRLHREIDRAIALAPRDTELWVAKGALLLNLPTFLGGDRDEAERWLVAAFVVDPDNQSIRAYLTQTLE